MVRICLNFVPNICPEVLEYSAIVYAVPLAIVLVLDILIDIRFSACKIAHFIFLPYSCSCGKLYVFASNLYTYVLSQPAIVLS